MIFPDTPQSHNHRFTFLSILFFRNYCLHDPTSNADLTYRAKIKFSVSHERITSMALPDSSHFLTRHAPDLDNLTAT